jgi:membrane fusion protein, multidrug efflux system
VVGAHVRCLERRRTSTSAAAEIARIKEKNVKRSVVIITIGLVLFLAGSAFWYVRTQPQVDATAPTPPATPVIAAKVTVRNVPILLPGVGTVIAYNTDIVRSQIQGELVQIAFTEGQTVKVGDLLAQIDPRPYQAQIAQLTANRERDSAQLTNAQANLSRYAQLGDKGYATPQLIETQKAQVAQLEASVKSDQALIDQANVQLGYTRLTSPIPGITGIRQIDVGNVIHPTDPNGLVVVTQIEPISLLFTLPQNDLPRIQQQMAKGDLKVIAYSQDDKAKLDEGKLLLVNNEIAGATGTIQLKAEFPNAAHRLWPGQLVNARLLLETRSNALTVAASAVQQGPKGTYVYVVKPDSTAALRPVTVLQISAGQALIDSGLMAGDVVVVDGQYRLKEGSRVVELHGKAAQEADLQSSVQEALP